MLEVEAEIGQRGDRLNPRFADLPVGVEGEAQKRIGIQPALVPTHHESVVLPMTQAADQVGGFAELDTQFAVLLGYHHVAVPGVAIGVGIAAQGQ